MEPASVRRVLPAAHDDGDAPPPPEQPQLLPQPPAQTVMLQQAAPQPLPAQTQTQPQAQTQGQPAAAPHYQEINELRVVLPAGYKPGDPFALRVEGVAEMINVAFPADGVAGATYPFRLERPVRQQLAGPPPAQPQQPPQQQPQPQQQQPPPQQPQPAPSSATGTRKRGRGYTKLKLSELQAELVARGIAAEHLPRAKSGLTACLQRLDDAAAEGAEAGALARAVGEINAENAAAAAAKLAERQRKKEAQRAAKRAKRTDDAAPAAAAEQALGGAEGVERAASPADGPPPSPPVLLSPGSSEDGGDKNPIELLESQMLGSECAIAQPYMYGGGDGEGDGPPCSMGLLVQRAREVGAAYEQRRCPPAIAPPTPTPCPTPSLAPSGQLVAWSEVQPAGVGDGPRELSQQWTAAVRPAPFLCSLLPHRLDMERLCS